MSVQAIDELHLHLTGRPDRDVRSSFAVLRLHLFDEIVVWHHPETVVDTDPDPILVDHDFVEVSPLGLPSRIMAA